MRGEMFATLRVALDRAFDARNDGFFVGGARFASITTSNRNVQAVMVGITVPIPVPMSTRLRTTTTRRPKDATGAEFIFPMVK